jgi:hypothetical protein
MFRNLLAKYYHLIPGIHELAQIRDSLYELRSNMGALQAHQFELALSAHARYGDPQRLLRYALQVCSQNGEDGMIQEVFRRIGTTDRIFVEIGVGNGSENNTAFLLSQGWTGFWIDGNPKFLKVIGDRKDLSRDCLQGLVSTVSRENVSALFQQLKVPEVFDLLSLDIDQNTYYAWEGLAGYRPRVVVVEYNASILPGVEWKVRYEPNRMADGTHNYGASLKALELLGRRLGYSLVGCDFIGVNAFFVRNDLTDGRFSAPFTSENHFEPPRLALTHRRGHRASILDRTGTEPREYQK